MTSLNKSHVRGMLSAAHAKVDEYFYRMEANGQVLDVGLTRNERKAKRRAMVDAELGRMVREHFNGEPE